VLWPSADLGPLVIKCSGFSSLDFAYLSLKLSVEAAVGDIGSDGLDCEVGMGTGGDKVGLMGAVAVCGGAGWPS